MDLTALWKFTKPAAPCADGLCAIALSVALALCGRASLAMAQGAPPPGSAAAPQTTLPGVVIYPPPAGFDPLTASDAALAFYGFPPRPDVQRAPDAYAHWHKMASTPHARLLHPQLQPTSLHHGPARQLSAGEILSSGAVLAASSNWSGYAVVGSAGTFTADNAYIVAEYIVPVASQPSAAAQAAGRMRGSGSASTAWGPRMSSRPGSRPMPTAQGARRQRITPRGMSGPLPLPSGSATCPSPLAI